MASERTKRQIIILASIVGVMGTISVILINLNSRQSQLNAQQASNKPETNTTGQRTIVAESDRAIGRYTTYKPELVADSGYERTVLFFTADHEWCDQCRAFEQAIIDEGLPDGSQILAVDFETEDELKKQYQITVQTTFVEVDQQGQLISSWVGFAQEKSVDAILNGLDQSSEGEL